MTVQGHLAEREPVVLCVDDDAEVLAALRRLLRTEPYEVITAANAAQGLASLRTRPVDVVVSDERMPDAGGCELLAEVRERWPWVRRVILTGHPGHSVILRGFEAGVDVLFHKPWDNGALKNAIRRLIYGTEAEPLQAKVAEERVSEADLGVKRAERSREQPKA